jgi:hypothetical protein
MEMSEEYKKFTEAVATSWVRARIFSENKVTDVTIEPGQTDHGVTDDNLIKFVKCMPQIKIIFVGIHHKPGLPALCSSTRTGKLIDRVIASELDGLHPVKSNLYELDHIPTDRVINFRHYVAEWKKRTRYNERTDIVVGLGVEVCRDLNRAKINFVRARHPSARWSQRNQEKYIKEVVDNCVDYLKARLFNSIRKLTEVIAEKTKARV